MQAITGIGVFGLCMIPSGAGAMELADHSNPEGAENDQGDAGEGGGLSSVFIRLTDTVDALFERPRSPGGACELLRLLLLHGTELFQRIVDIGERKRLVQHRDHIEHR